MKTKYDIPWRFLLVITILLLGLSVGMGLSQAQGPGGSPSVTPAAVSVSAPAAGHRLYLPLTQHIALHTTCRGEVDPPTVGWASGDEGALLRWRWPSCYPHPTAYKIYRNGALLTTVQRVSDEGTAKTLLGDSLWSWLKNTYEVASIAELHAFLDDNAAADLWLADQHYQLALVRGTGYLDTGAQLGQTYRYKITALLPGEIEYLVGKVAVTHNGLTPLPAPTGLQEVQVLDEGLMGSPDWARAQQNRKADSRVFLRWDLPTGSVIPDTWVTSYDVYRSTGPAGPFQRITVQDGEDRPVVPSPSYEPDTLPGDSAYQQYEYFFQDNDPALQACQTYYYRIAPRDLLGNARDWNDPQQRAQFSAPIAATPPDTVPPAAPQGLSAAPDHLAGTIALSWEAVPDAAHYIVYRSDSPQAAWPGLNPAAASQWMTMTITTDVSWVDSSAAYEQQYWYVVRAEDAPCGGHPANLSAPSQPVHAILHDRTPPAKPKIGVTYVYVGKTRIPLIQVIGPAGDTGSIALYCSFDNGPEHLILTQKGETLALNLYEYYQPPYPLPAACRAIAIDPHGNHSDPSSVVTANLPVLPGDVPPPSAPIIRDIVTMSGGDYGWTADVQWDALDTPCLSGFRVYRQAVGQSEVLLADESALGPDRRAFSDTTVQWGVVYTYTVAAYRASGACGAGAEVPSQPQVYRVTQPPEFPGRWLQTMAWNNSSYTAGQGTWLRWQSERKLIRYVVFRSLARDRGYVAITPPLHGSDYLDSSALHDHYWYVVVGLDPITGETIAATPPWSANPSQAAETSQPTVTAPASSQSSAIPAIVGALPSVLYFGDGFELHVISYDPKSSLDDLNGTGKLYLYPNTLLLKVELTFAHLKANKSGLILDGQIEAPDAALPINVTSANSFHYQITSLQVDKVGGSGTVKVFLPASVYYHWYLAWPYPIAGINDYVTLGSATIHPQLTFQRSLDYNLPCDESTNTYFQLEDLPWHIIPTGTITYTESAISFDTVCTRYHERYTGARPPSGEADANDALLRPTYTSSNASITPGGLAGDFGSGSVVSYAVPFPYGFRLTLSHPNLTLEDGWIIDGHVSFLNSVVSFDYFQSIPQTNPWADKGQGAPEGQWSGTLNRVEIGPGGSIYANANKTNTFPRTRDISWLNGGFTLRNQTYELYIPPIQSQRQPWADALWPTTYQEDDDGRQLEPGLNLRTDAADLVWSDCSTDGPITFPNGVEADLYIRRGGVSDLLHATIPLGSPQSAILDGYQTRLQSFLAVFFDNAFYDKDISGSFYLPGPTDALIPFSDASLDDNACISNADVTTAAVTPTYWQTTLHPTSLEFREPDPDPAAPGKRGLWLIGDVDIPHMAPMTSTTVAAIPLETAFKPDGNFFDITLQYDAVNYQLDGLPYLLEDVRLSDWATREDPGWVADAGLDAPPTTAWKEHGFIGLNGQLLTPIFGTVQGKNSGQPPEVFVLGWDDYVGFSDALRVARTWTVITDHVWSFDLLYVPSPDKNGAMLVGFRRDQYKIVELDQALVLRGEIGQEPRFDLLLGQSSGAGLLRAMAEETQASLPGNFDEIRPTLEGWRSAYFSSMSEDYLDLLETLWPKYGEDDYTKTTAKIDGMKDKDIPLKPNGGGATASLSNTGVKLKKLRGDLAWFYDNNTGDWDFEEMRVSLWLDIKKSDEKEPLFHGDRITFYLTRDNDYVLEAMGLKSNLFQQKDLSVDFTGVVNPDEPRVEVGLMLHELKVDPIEFKNIGAALGVGPTIYYLGALADAKYQGATIGGAFLFGRLDPDSIVLRNMGFGDLLDTLTMTGVPQDTILVGGYLRFYGDVPIYNYSCLFRVTVGGKIAVWYFADTNPEHSGNDAWGGQLGGYVTGQILCVVSARGDLTLTLYQRPDRENISMAGQFWVAGGIGWCDPGSWDTWDNRWWGDSWCWTCGAMVEANYNVDKVDDWAWSYDADYE